MKENNLLAEILNGKKELVRLFVIATVLAFSVGALASLFAAQTILPEWSVITIAALLILISFGLLARDLASSLSFEEEFEGVIFLDPDRNEILSVRDYVFSEKLQKTLLAVKAENKSIYSEWEKSPLVQRPKSKEPMAKSTNDDVSDRPTYISIFKVTVDEKSETPPLAARLLEEAASFVLIEELSLHLSTYFNDSKNDSYIKEYKREDIPSFLLKNRVLNLLSTPIEHRDIFLNAFPDSAKRPQGELCSIWGSDGSMYSRFDLVLPHGTIIQHSDVGSVKIETKRLSIELTAKHSRSGAVVGNAFLANYVGVAPRSIECRKLPISLKCRIKPASLFSSNGWQYYQWLDSFRDRLRKSMDFPTFQNDIHWQIIEPLLYSMRNRQKPPKTSSSAIDANPRSNPPLNSDAPTSGAPVS